MRVDTLKEILATYKDDDLVAVIFFEKHEAEERYEAVNDEVDINWKHIVEDFESDKDLSSLADTTFDDAVFHNLGAK